MRCDWVSELVMDCRVGRSVGRNGRTDDGACPIALRLARNWMMLAFNGKRRKEDADRAATNDETES